MSKAYIKINRGDENSNHIIVVAMVDGSVDNVWAIDAENYSLEATHVGRALGEKYGVDVVFAVGTLCDEEEIDFATDDTSLGLPDLLEIACATVMFEDENV